MNIPGLSIREDDGVLCWNNVPIEFRATMWDGMPVAKVAARIGPHGPSWVVDHASTELAAQIRNLSAHRLEAIWQLPSKVRDEEPDRPEH
jgi:hypothetical protein